MDGTMTIYSESAQRAEWKSLVAALEARGVLAPAPAPREGFAAATLEAARGYVRRLRLRAWWVGLVGAGIAAAVAVSLVPMSAAPRAEGGIGRAQAWLASVQGADGTWAEAGAHAPAVTAVAALALAGRSPAGADGAAAKAISALEKMQGPEGAFGSSGLATIYNHAFASFALMEDAAARGAGVTPAVARAIAFAVSTQNPDGSWGCSGAAGDAALTVWEAGILARARGLGWGDDAGALRRAVAWLRRSGGEGLLDYRMAFGRESKPAFGNMALTRLATDALTGYLEGFPGQERLSGKLVSSLDVACFRDFEDGAAAVLAAAPRNVFDVAVALLSANRAGE